MLLVLIPIVHLLGALLCLIGDRAARAVARVSWAVSAGLVVAVSVAVTRAGELTVRVGGWPTRMGVELACDQVSLAFLALLTILHGSVLAYEWGTRRRRSFYVLVSVLVGAAAAFTLSRDLFNMYVLLELLTLASYLLVGHARRPEQLWASLKYLVLASFGMGLFLMGAAVIYAHLGTMNLPAIGEGLRAAGDAPWARLAAALLVTGIGVKSGIFVLSLWLPAAHAVAPSSISALLSGVVVKMGVLGLLRFAEILPVHDALLVLGVLTGLLGIGFALFERDLKRMLAYSTLSQIGYALVAFSVGTRAGALAGDAYLAAHGLFKATLFLAAGTAIRATGETAVDRIAAARQKIPRAAGVALAVGTLGIVGLPPLAGFWAKELILTAGGGALVSTMVVVLGVGTAAPFARIIPLLRLGRAGGVRVGERVALAALSLGVVAFGGSVVWWRGGYGPALGQLALEAARAVAVAATGALAYALLKRSRVRLRCVRFFLEEATLIVLVVFFVVFALVGAD